MDDSRSSSSHKHPKHKQLTCPTLALVMLPRFQVMEKTVNKALSVAYDAASGSKARDLHQGTVAIQAARQVMKTSFLERLRGGGKLADAAFAVKGACTVDQTIGRAWKALKRQCSLPPASKKYETAASRRLKWLSGLNPGTVFSTKLESTTENGLIKGSRSTNGHEEGDAEVLEMGRLLHILPKPLQDAESELEPVEMAASSGGPYAKERAQQMRLEGNMEADHVLDAADAERAEFSRDHESDGFGGGEEESENDPEKPTPRELPALSSSSSSGAPQRRVRSVDLVPEPPIPKRASLPRRGLAPDLTTGFLRALQHTSVQEHVAGWLASLVADRAPEADQQVFSVLLECGRVGRAQQAVSEALSLFG